MTFCWRGASRDFKSVWTSLRREVQAGRDGPAQGIIHSPKRVGPSETSKLLASCLCVYNPKRFSEKQVKKIVHESSEVRIKCQEGPPNEESQPTEPMQDSLLLSDTRPHVILGAIALLLLPGSFKAISCSGAGCINPIS